MRKILIGAAIAASAYGVYHWSASSPAADGGSKLVVDRLWIDHLPRSERETFQVFAAVSEHSMGAFNQTSVWRGSYERFRFELQGGELRLLFPQTGERERVKARAWKCNEGRMDFCLELDGGTRGAKRYYSREGWEIRSDADVEARLETLEAGLPAGE